MIRYARCINPIKHWQRSFIKAIGIGAAQFGGISFVEMGKSRPERRPHMRLDHRRKL